MLPAVPPALPRALRKPSKHGQTACTISRMLQAKQPHSGPAVSQATKSMSPTIFLHPNLTLFLAPSLEAQEEVWAHLGLRAVRIPCLKLTSNRVLLTCGRSTLILAQKPAQRPHRIRGQNPGLKVQTIIQASFLARPRKQTLAQDPDLVECGITDKMFALSPDLWAESNEHHRVLVLVQSAKCRLYLKRFLIVRILGSIYDCSQRWNRKSGPGLDQATTCGCCRDLHPLREVNRY